ncbi:MAG: hypothetical protein BRC31_03970 [Actinobacteria bacterium QS_5_72_10]|nr:MAG: hypothetical protein BRC31_03970 [Actinobacteria bacterium QS_5_72_10]
MASPVSARARVRASEAPSSELSVTFSSSSTTGASASGGELCSDCTSSCWSSSESSSEASRLLASAWA